MQLFLRGARCSSKVSIVADGALTKANHRSSSPQHTLRPGSVITALGSVRTKIEMVHPAAFFFNPDECHLQAAQHVDHCNCKNTFFTRAILCISEDLVAC